MDHVKYLHWHLTLLSLLILFIVFCSNKDSVSPENTTPIASFTVSPDSGNTLTIFNFDASGCGDAEDPPSDLQVHWDWENDGTWDTNFSTTKTATHQYATEGTKSINLEVIDSGGLSNITTQQITISPNTPPIASFTVSPDSGTKFTIFTFYAYHCSDTEDLKSDLQVRWDWENDGTWDTNFSTTKIAEHQYTTDGVKSINLEVKDSGGLTNTTTKQILVIQVTMTDQDGNVYQTVLIGTQWWMAENLKVTSYRNGDPIPNVTKNSEWGNLSTGAYCNYDNDANNADIYGCLYNWYAVIDSRNIAPESWHVPTDYDWGILETYFGMSSFDALIEEKTWRGTDEGGKLKEAGTEHWDSPNTGATNESGFTALPAGLRWVRTNHVGFISIGVATCYWSSSTCNHASGKYYRRLDYNHSDIFRSYEEDEYGFSVRLVRDN